MKKIFEKLFGIKYHTFTKVVEGIGEFTSRATSEKKCKCWTHNFDYGPLTNIELTISNKELNDPDHLAIYINEYTLARQNTKAVFDAIEKDEAYTKAKNDGCSPLMPDGQVYAELSAGDGNMDPAMMIYYGTGRYHAWMSIQAGEMTCFDLESEQ